ncbi:MAG: N-6 DNA methylase [Acidiferrobacterales bacterium]|nr:N-6 DNA methylase [Acidiferrobacterales bacterium]
MTNSEVILTKLVDDIRKDAGVNNAIDAMEQLSLILLLKYFYGHILAGVPGQEHIGDFKYLFFTSNEYDEESIEIDFSKLKSVLAGMVSDAVGHESMLYRHHSVNETWKKIQHILDNIPLKIRSKRTLKRLIFELDFIDLNESLADSYDKLVVKMIDDSLSAGAFHSPKALVAAIVNVVGPCLGQSIYDPAMGTGRFLIEAKKFFCELSENSCNGSFQAVGRDISPFACLVGSVNLLLNEIGIEDISLDDSLLVDDEQAYDIIFSGIPFGQPSNIDKYKYKDDLKYRRNYNRYTSNLEALFVEHSMRMLTQGGKAAIIVPEGLLFNRTHELLALRRELLTSFDLHTILSLPSGALAPYSAVKTSVLFFDNAKPRNDIWFYELKSEKPLNKTNKVSDDDLKEFTELFSKRNESASSCLVNKQDILNRGDLNLSLKLPRIDDELDSFNVADELTVFKKKNESLELLTREFLKSVSSSKQAKFEEKVTIGELFKTKAGKTLNKSEILEDGPYPVYGGNGVIGYFHDFNRTHENIFIGRVGAHCGNVHFVEGDVWVTNNAFSVELDSSLKVHLPYLFHVLRSLDLNKLAQGVAQPSISYSKIKDVEVYLPSYEQQVELSKWFEELYIGSLSLEKAFNEQKEKIKKMAEHAIFSNCIKDIS